MKRKLLLLLSIACFSISNYYSQDSEEEPLKLKGVVMENDYHEKITWIKSKPVALVEKDFTISAYDCSYIQLYFGLYMEGETQMITPIRIVNAYNNSEWIFFDEISYLLGSKKDIKAGKGRTFKLYDKETKTKVDGAVIEKSDVIASDEVIDFIMYVIDTPETRMEVRYQNNRDSRAYDLKVHNGTKKLKKHFTTFIEAYRQTTEKLSLDNQLEQ